MDEIKDYNHYSATYSPEDNKLRLSSISRLPKELYERVRAAGFIWAPKQEIFVAPMWTPDREDLLIELCGEIGDEDTSLVDRQEQRAERFEEYSEKRADDAEQAHKAVNAITEHIPLGQPILVGHHSERHARKDAEKIENGMRKAVRMWETSEYWKQRAIGAKAHASYKMRPDVRHRRIKGLMSDLRREQKEKELHEGKLLSWNHPGEITDRRAYAITNDGSCSLSMCFPADRYPRPEGVRVYEGSMSLWSALQDKIITPEKAKALSVPYHEARIRRINRWIAHIEHRLEYERAMLAEDGGTAADKFSIEVGGRVLVRDGWAVVLKVNKAGGAINSVTCTAPTYVTWSKTWKYGIEQVKDYRAPEGEDAAKVAKAMKLPPICNYPGADFVHITQAEWNRKHKDYKSTHVIAANETHGKHRVRWGMFAEYKRGYVFITDAKRVDPPAAAMVTAAPLELKTERDPDAPRRTAYQTPEPNKFDALKDALKAGVKVVSAPQLFPTPRELAARMVELADIRAGHRVLEPSAGTGAIVDALPDQASITAVEINNSLCRRLNTMPKITRTVEADFLECNGDLGKFDRILMNPPFQNGADIQHITHALKFLKPDGILVAICANGPRQNDKLRPIVDERGGEWEELPEGTFKDQGTGVRTVLLTIPA
jgi:protein-L-isoaspartate O-methyltransferase